MTFFINGPTGQLEAIEHKPDSTEHPITAIICHPHPLFEGTMHNKVVTTLARTCDALKIHSIRFNYRGVGESAGEYGEIEGEVDDCMAVIDWVTQHQPHNQLWLMGFSFGAYIAARAAIAAKSKQLVCIAPAVEHAHFMDLPEVHCPWLVVQGDKDEVVPPQMVYDFVEKRPENITLYKLSDTGHFFHGKLVDLKCKLVQYLQTSQLDK